MIYTYSFDLYDQILVERNARLGVSSQPTDTGDMDAIVEDELSAFSEIASKLLLECLSNYFARFSGMTPLQSIYIHVYLDNQYRY